MYRPYKMLGEIGRMLHGHIIPIHFEVACKFFSRSHVAMYIMVSQLFWILEHYRG